MKSGDFTRLLETEVSFWMPNLILHAWPVWRIMMLAGSPQNSSLKSSICGIAAIKNMRFTSASVACDVIDGTASKS
jgi:hypothetical protein